MVYIDRESYNIYQPNDVRVQQLSVFKVDEFIAPSISLLGKKGYITEFCCSGHLTAEYYGSGSKKDTPKNVSPTVSSPNNSSYIIFSDSEQFKNIDYFPERYDVKVNEYESRSRLILRCNYKNNNVEDRFLEIIRAMVSLYQWVKQLPDIKL